MTTDIEKGLRLAPDEKVVWEGAPSWGTVACDVYHLRGVSAYLAFLVALDAYQAWVKALPLGEALHNSVPLAVIIALVLVNVAGLAWLTTRTTRYTITTRRVILAYGIALPATLAIPHTKIQNLELALGRKHKGDIALTLAVGNHMPYLKLWPHARPWRVTHPQPMLRGVPQAAVVAGLATRAFAASAQTRAATVPPVDVLAA